MQYVINPWRIALDILIDHLLIASKYKIKALPEQYTAEKSVIITRGRIHGDERDKVAASVGIDQTDICRGLSYRLLIIVDHKLAVDIRSDPITSQRRIKYPKRVKLAESFNNSILSIKKLAKNVIYDLFP